jgi:CheY-like chemotaxis protein
MSIIRPVNKLAQQYTEEAIEKLADIMRNGEDRQAISASKELLDRGHGKTPQAVTVQAHAEREALAMLSDADLDAIIMEAPMPRKLIASKKDPLLD